MFHFVANLKPYTFHRGRGVRRFDAYLLSADYERAQRRLAQRVRAEDRLLVADNGNVDAIRGLTDRFRRDARELDQRRAAEEERRGRYVRPGDLSRALTRAYQALASRIRDAAAAVVTDDYVCHAVERQQRMQPSYLVGMEDLTIATLTSLSVEPEYAMLPADFYRALNQRAVQYAVDTRAGRFGPCDGRVFAGLHAMSYDQAFDAGALAGHAGVDGIAIGLFGALTDRSHVDYRVHGGTIIELGATVARPYARVLEIAAGVVHGHVHATGRRPDLHALGAGSPVLIPLLSRLASARSTVATDSTAPIVDGWTGPTISLYVDEPAPLKLKAHRIAEEWLRGGRGWDCECHACRGFARRHPARLLEARRWWIAKGRPRIAKAHLGRRGPLARLLPYLGQHPDDTVRRLAGLARVGHNHHVLQRLERLARDTASNAAWVDELTAAYVADGGSAP